MKQQRIVIKVWRGLVSEVFADDPQVQVIIIDGDAGEEQQDEPPVELPPHQVY